MPRFYNRRCTTSNRQPLGENKPLILSDDAALQNQMVEEALTKKLVKLAKGDKSGDLVEITLKYFTFSDNVKFYVKTILNLCIEHGSMIEVVTLNFYALTSIKRFGLAIKYEMYSVIDLFTMQLNFLFAEGELEDQTQLLNFYLFIGLLYFRFRSNEFTRHQRLVNANVEALLHLSSVNSVQSLSLLTKLMQLNYTALLHSYSSNDKKHTRYEWFKKINQISTNLRSLSYIQQTHTTRWLVLAAMDFSVSGPILIPMYENLYKTKLKKLWIPLEMKIPVHMRAEISSSVIKDSLEQFDELIDNFILGTFCSDEELL